MIVTCSGRKEQGKFMKEVQKKQYDLSNDDICTLINMVKSIMAKVDDQHDLSVRELRILEESHDLYDSFLVGFYKGMMYQKGRNQIVMEEKINVAPVQPEQEEDDHFKLHIVNSQYGIASCKLCDISPRYLPCSVRNGKDLMQTLFFYMKERDMIVLNEDNMLSHAFGELLVELLPLPDEEKAKEMTRLKEVSSEYFAKLVTVLGIQEYRRMMGYPTGFHYVDDADMVYSELQEHTPPASEQYKEAFEELNSAFSKYMDAIHRESFRYGYTVAAERRR